MKRKYIKPSTTLDKLLTDYLMESFSLPTTGVVNDPTFGQANEFTFDEEESENSLPEVRIWDDEL